MNMSDHLPGSISETTLMISNATIDRSSNKQESDNSGSFADVITNFFIGRTSSKPAAKNDNVTSDGQTNNKKQLEKNTEMQQQANFTPQPMHMHPQPPSSPPPTPSKKACRAPLSKKFAHPCTCSQLSHHKSLHNNQSQNNTGSLPPAAYTAPLHLYDPATKRCLPTSRIRDMLLKECRSNVPNPYSISHQLHHGTPCYYEDLVCDARRNRCVCKSNLHLFYEGNSSTFGCVPIGTGLSPEGKAMCRTGYIFNPNSRECQKIFDVNDLPPTYTAGVSATQFSFVTIVLIWVLLLILIVTAKLRKLRSTNLYRNSPNSERGSHRGSSYRHHNNVTDSAWLAPLIAAVNGQYHQPHNRSSEERQAMEDSENHNVRDFFLPNGTRRLNELFGPDGQLAGSQQSLNNPPPKFEEIYPASQPDEQLTIQPPSTEDLPTYDEAMKLQNTMPPDPTNQKE